MNLIIIFILGGILLTGIYYSANIIENPALSAIVSLLPLSIICGYIIHKKDILISHYKNVIYVYLITILCVSITILLLKQHFNKYIVVSFILILWIILQYTIVYKSHG